jgi:fumarate hydratase class I
VGATRLHDQEDKSVDSPAHRPASFSYSPIFPLAPATTPWRKLPIEGVRTISVEGKTVLRVAPEALSELAVRAFHDVSHLLRPAHLAQLRAILDDPEASSNDRFVALDLLKNANIAAGGVLPMCQDTGTAIVFGKKGQRVWVDGNEEEALSWGVHRTYTETNLRYSQMAPLSMFEEVNTGNNLPVQFDIMAVPGEDDIHDDSHAGPHGHAAEFHLMFVAKGGGSANKTFLFQETRAILSPERLAKFLETKMKTLGTSACPPYHLAVVIGGTSAEMTLKTVKLASTKWLDGLPTRGDKSGHAFRDLNLERQILELSAKIGIGAQFGGKYFCHDVRVVRLPRHGASLPVGIGVSCSADRQILAKITPEGVFLERLETDPATYLPETIDTHLGEDTVPINLNRPMHEVRAELSRYPVKTRLSLTGTMVVARDIAHAKLKERLDNGLPLPDYMKDHPVYYAGPAKTPDGMATGSFGPTTAGRMDSYVAEFQAAGGSLVMLAKGNRSKAVKDACRNYGGFYLGSVGGAAARLAQDCIRKVDVLEFPELGMEAVWQIEVENFPAFIIIDDKGNDFYDGLG